MIRRRVDWRSRLLCWSALQVGRPFVWGQTDCATLGRSALTEIFGVDVMPWLPTWHSAREAVQVVQTYGPVESILEKLGACGVSSAFMRAGDLVVMREPEEEIGRVAIMVCIDGRECIVSRHTGVVLERLPLLVEGAQAYSLWGCMLHE